MCVCLMWCVCLCVQGIEMGRWCGGCYTVNHSFTFFFQHHSCIQWRGYGGVKRTKQGERTQMRYDLQWHWVSYQFQYQSSFFFYILYLFFSWRYLWFSHDNVILNKIMSLNYRLSTKTAQKNNRFIYSCILPSTKKGKKYVLQNNNNNPAYSHGWK